MFLLSGSRKSRKAYTNHVFCDLEAEKSKKSIYKIMFFVIWKQKKQEKHMQNKVFCMIRNL